MKIAASAINLNSQRIYTEKQTRNESLRVWADDTPRLGVQSSEPSTENQAYRLHGTMSKKQGHECAADISDVDNSEEEPQLDAKLEMIKSIVERMLGRKIKLLVLPTEKQESVPSSSQTEQEATAATTRQGWGIQYDLKQSYSESEQTSFEGSGVVQTADGKQISFTLKLNMARRFTSEENVSLRAGDAATDPLVISFNGSAVQLSSARFSFDIDADGQQENVASLNDGYGFLALDLNGDGVINDGGELFGPKTGNGFAELAAYDGDGNGWIDESDEVYDQLKVWVPGSEGNEGSTDSGDLSGLRDHGVGALYLGYQSTPFDLNDAQNENLGQVVSSGLYLTEDGSAGPVQQVNLVV